jgi:hypothetical protein
MRRLRIESASSVRPRAPFVRRHAVRVTSALAGTALALATGSARAEGTSLRADLVRAKDLKLDGVPKEWPEPLVPLSRALKGRVGKPDLEARAVLAYDESRVYVGADVTDDALVAGGDRVELVLGFPGGATRSVLLYPGNPGKTPGAAKTAAGDPIAGAKVVEAPRAGGWSLEASVPWSAFPEAATVRVGLRAGLFVHDVDDGGAEQAIAGSATGTSWAALPPLLTEPEQALADGLLREKGLRGAPRFEAIADVAGDAMKERVLLFDRWLVVLGPSFRGGKEYFFSDLGVDPGAGMLPAFEVRDVSGDDKSELVLRRRFGSASRFREVMAILAFGGGEVPNPIFQHEVGVTTDVGSVANDVALVQDGRRLAVRVEVGAAKGYHAGNYREPTETSFAPVLLPWGTIRSQTYKLTGASYTKVDEQSQPATPPPAAAEPPAPPPPRAPSADELVAEVYATYKRERNTTGRPRFDLAVDVAGDARVERVLLHDRDIVVFGKGFRGGKGYAFLTLPQLASSADVLDLTTRDLTGDGKQEIVVKAVQHAPAPKEAGGVGTVDREIVLVFQVSEGGIRRIFGAEIARAVGTKRVSGTLRFVGAGASTEIELAPGKAVEWTEKTYPWGQDPGPVGGLEPLLLPWGDARPVRHRWNGSAFAR